MKINLCTRNGDFVTELEIPPFQVMPEMIMWGDRAFFLAALQGGEPTEYIEGIMYAIPRINW